MVAIAAHKKKKTMALMACGKQTTMLLSWKSKQTDTYRMDLKTIGDYRDNLLQKQEIKNNNSLLLVMGSMSKEEDLVSQVKGSPRAWDTRIITVGSLIQLVELKVKGSSGLNPDYFYKILQTF